MYNLYLLLIFYIIIVASYFSPKIASLGHKKMTERELVSIAPRHFGIRKKYFIWGCVVTLAMFFTIHFGLEIANSFPEIRAGLYLLTGVVTVSCIPLCQALFAFVTGVYPSGQRDDFVFDNRDVINFLAIRGIFLVFLLIGVALVLAMYPSII